LKMFEGDLNLLLERLTQSVDEETRGRLVELRDRLVHLNSEGLVKINHSVMELICAKYLILDGYEVNVEYFLDGLSCDIYAVKCYGTLIIEVETGFIPPKHALDPLTYCRARIASKISRYSGYANKFCLGIPPHYLVQIPVVLTKPPRYRTPKEVDEVKDLCDMYYSTPPVSLEEIRNARIHAIYILDVDGAVAREMDLNGYAEKVAHWSL
jgi:hypothetical protein